MCIRDRLHGASSVIPRLVDMCNNNGGNIPGDVYKRQQKIHNFLQQYYIYNLGISENEKQSIEKILEIPIRSKQNYSIERFSPMQYKAKTAQIENETRQILQESTEKPNYPKFKINAWKTHSLRTYVDQVNLFTNQGILKNKEKKEIDYDLRHN